MSSLQHFNEVGGSLEYVESLMVSAKEANILNEELPDKSKPGHLLASFEFACVAVPGFLEHVKCDECGLIWLRPHSIEECYIPAIMNS